MVEYKGLGYKVPISAGSPHPLLPNPTPSLADQFAEWSIVYLRAAEKLYEIKQGFSGFWIPAYHLLHRSMELALKSVLASHHRKILKGQKGHDLIELINSNADLFVFSAEEATAIVRLEKLNQGMGGLRYPDNEKEGQFLPSTFSESIKIICKLVQWPEESQSS